MQEDIFLPAQRSEAALPTTRELLAIGFRHRRLGLLSFLGILAGALVVAPMLPKYRARGSWSLARGCGTNYPKMATGLNRVCQGLVSPHLERVNA
jgi:hypothetical protein